MYKLIFYNHGKIYELFAERVDSSHLYGFIEASKLMFSTDSRVVVDPTEERLRDEFRDTESLLLPLQSVVRVEKVNQRGACVIRERKSGDKVTVLPVDGPGRRGP